MAVAVLGLLAAGDPAYAISVKSAITDADWVSMKSGFQGVNGSIYALACDASGTLYVGGRFRSAGEVMANNIAKWDGSSWSALGTGLNFAIHALAVDASGNVYAGGEFWKAGVVKHCQMGRLVVVCPRDGDGRHYLRPCGRRIRQYVCRRRVYNSRGRCCQSYCQMGRHDVVCPRRRGWTVLFRPCGRRIRRCVCRWRFYNSRGRCCQSYCQMGRLDVVCPWRGDGWQSFRPCGRRLRHCVCRRRIFNRRKPCCQ